MDMLQRCLFSCLTSFFWIDGWTRMREQLAMDVCSRADDDSKRRTKIFSRYRLHTYFKMKTTLLAIVAALLSASVASASGAVELTMLNFKDKTNGKNAFVKFLAPWVSQLCLRLTELFSVL